AKGVTPVAVRVLDCTGTGSWSGVIAGIDWVTANHTPGSVANLSLGGPANPAVDEAVNRSIAAGVTHVVAAGDAHAGPGRHAPARGRPGRGAGRDRRPGHPRHRPLRRRPVTQPAAADPLRKGRTSYPLSAASRARSASTSKVAAGHCGSMPARAPVSRC